MSVGSKPLMPSAVTPLLTTLRAYSIWTSLPLTGSACAEERIPQVPRVEGSEGEGISVGHDSSERSDWGFGGCGRRGAGAEVSMDDVASRH